MSRFGEESGCSALIIGRLVVPALIGKATFVAARDHRKLNQCQTRRATARRQRTGKGFGYPRPDASRIHVPGDA